VATFVIESPYPSTRRHRGLNGSESPPRDAAARDPIASSLCCLGALARPSPVTVPAETDHASVPRLQGLC
jgi:hypothetical protein